MKRAILSSIKTQVLFIQEHDFTLTYTNMLQESKAIHNKEAMEKPKSLKL